MRTGRFVPAPPLAYAEVLVYRSSFPTDQPTRQMPIQGSQMRVLVTGVAGFIGYHVAKRLLSEGHTVSGLDNLSSYYDVELKKARLGDLNRAFGFSPAICDIADADAL